MVAKPDSPMYHGAPPPWSLERPKGIRQALYDFFGAPLRMVLFPDHVSERFHLTSLRAERLGTVLKEVEGRCLDVGAGDNGLVRLHQTRSAGTDQAAKAERSVGVDVFDWGAGCVIVKDCRHLPFEDGSFDTVCFIACLNHIPERREALREAFRVLRPGGKLVATMIGKLIGDVGHAIWWYSEDKHREIQDGELMGIDASQIAELVGEAGFVDLRRRGFVYGLNSLFVARRP